MIKFEATMESGKKVQSIVDEYAMHLVGIEIEGSAEPTELDIYTWIIASKVFMAKDAEGNKLLCVGSKVETIRKIAPKDWFKNS